VCGLRNGLNYSEFTDCITEYDIFCCTECKTESCDSFVVNGYQFFGQPRKQKFFRKSGGLGIFVKDKYAKHSKIIDSESDYVIWLELNCFSPYPLVVGCICNIMSSVTRRGEFIGIS